MSRGEGRGALNRISRADDAGAFSLRVLRGSYQLAAGGGTLGVAAVTLKLDEDDLGTERKWSPVLDRGLEIRGVVTLADGAPADGWIVQYERSGETLHCDTTVTSDGEFALPNLAGTGRLHIIAPGSEFASRVIDGVLPGSDPLAIVVPTAEGFLQVSIHVPDLPEMTAAEVWVRQVTSGRTSWLGWSDEREAHGQSLPTGLYHVIAGGAEHGYVDLGEVDLAAGGEATLRAVLPARGGMTWTPPETDGDLLWTLYRRGPSISSRMTTGALSEPPSLPLPAGDYELFVHGDELSAAAQRFTVTPGATPELELDPRGLSELSVRVVLPDETEQLAGVHLEVTNARGGVAVHTQRLAGPGVRIHLRSGRYVVAARTDDGNEVTAGVELPGAGSVELDLR